METLHVAILQSSPRPGDIEGNVERIVSSGAARSAHVLVTPELSLTGYDLGDRAAHLAVPVQIGEPIPGCSRLGEASAAIIAGLAECGPDEVTYNAIVAVKDGRVLHRHRKIHLPTYGTFDEARFWGHGRDIGTWDCEGWRFGLIVCEDFWHPGLVYALAHRNIQVLVVCAAAPGRGLREDTGAGRFASVDAWAGIARSTAHLYGIWVILANRVGVEGSLTFSGGSIAIGPDGSTLAQAASDECELRFDLTRSELRRVRRHFSHARDDDAGLVARALLRYRETPA